MDTCGQPEVLMNALRHCLFLLFACSLLFAQQPPADTRAAADKAFAARDWATAAAAYTELAPADKADHDVVICHRIGYCLHALGKLHDAMPWHERAAALADQDRGLAAKASYNIACVHALRGHKTEALAALQVAVERGFRNAEFMQHDTDLDSVRAEPAFRQLLASLERDVKIVAVVVHDNVEILDFAGPVEVFQSAHDDNGHVFRVVLVAPRKDPVRPSHLTAAIVPDYDLATCPQPAVLVIPGGSTRRLTDDAAFMAWVQRTAPKCEVVLSVCTGAFVLAKAGLLDGKPATTARGSLQRLQTQYPQVQVKPGEKVVDSGLCVTAAGVSSGLHGALHVVQRLCGTTMAVDVAEYMEYAWTPATTLDRAPVPK
jgi:putative intracellular protease/amidase